MTAITIAGIDIVIIVIIRTILLGVCGSITIRSVIIISSCCCISLRLLFVHSSLFPIHCFAVILSIIISSSIALCTATVIIIVVVLCLRQTPQKYIAIVPARQQMIQRFKPRKQSNNNNIHNIISTNRIRI